MSQATRTRDDGVKRPTNVSLNESLLAEANRLGVNISRACEQGLDEEVREARARQWMSDNEAGFDAWNRYVEKHGVPLAGYRKF